MPHIIYLACISSVACLVMGQSPYLTFLAAIVWGISMVIGGHYVNGKQLAFVFGLNLLLIYAITGSNGLFYALCFFGVPSFLMGYLLSLKKDYYDIQKMGVLSAVFTVSLFLALTYFYLGETQMQDIQMQAEEYMQENLSISNNSGLYKFYEEKGISREEIGNSITRVVQGLVKHLPAFYYLQTLLTVVIILALSTYICRAKNIPALKKRQFSEDVMPWQFVWGVIFALSLWLWGRDEMTSIYYVGSNLLVILATIAMYFGLASLAYRWNRLKPGKKRLVPIIFIMAGLFFTLPTIMFIGLLGIFDSLLDYRKMRSKEEVK
ncbi:MAG: DUF2232 domain-containing protein [Syntrophomonas sp.]|nr:DUF2232 domain-containing protein [Syntrophomonas sp.]